MRILLFSFVETAFVLFSWNRFWNADRMSLITFFPTPFLLSSPAPSIRSLAFSHEGKLIAVGYENGYTEIYQAMFGELFFFSFFSNVDSIDLD